MAACDQVELLRFTGAEAQFRKALEKDPSDATTRLIFADWLDEHGRYDEAFGQRWQAKHGVYPEDGGDRWNWWAISPPEHARLGRFPVLFQRMCLASGPPDGQTPENRSDIFYNHPTLEAAERVLASFLTECRAAGEEV